ncbi:MAG TPA: hypothetical protein PK397_04300 [Ignavibacteriaceae bacterium]|jgi:septal ring factor EnvC (AmiA/AmiB activator)|nr:hypothetical protein [Ignavibacteriaceae bacterium]
MKLKGIVLAASFAFATIGFIGCGGGVSEEQLAQLDALKKEVSSLEKEANTLKEERSKLEREIAEKNKKLEECAKLKQETKANLEKLPK